MQADDTDRLVVYAFENARDGGEDEVHEPVSIRATVTIQSRTSNEVNSHKSDI